METQWKQKESMWEERGRQKHTVKWGSLETENIWPSYASYFAFPRLGALVLKEILVSGRPASRRRPGNKGHVLAEYRTVAWLVRWFSLFPLLGQVRQKRQSGCQTVTAELELSPLSLHSLPFQPADVSPREHTTLLQNSTPAGFAVHLARLHLQLGYPRYNTQQFYHPGTQSWSCSNCSIHFPYTWSGKRRGQIYVKACWWEQPTKYKWAPPVFLMLRSAG